MSIYKRTLNHTSHLFISSLDHSPRAPRQSPPPDLQVHYPLRIYVFYVSDVGDYLAGGGARERIRPTHLTIKGQEKFTSQDVTPENPYAPLWD